jgi:poly(A) polymerase
LLNKPLLNPPTVIPRSNHSISRAQISPNALKVLYRLRGAGYRACLVGGGVRDLLLKRQPKDFDIGTDAHPEDVYRLFRNCRLIGRRFRLAHVYFDQEVIEVATFRALHTPGEDDEHEDALRDENGLIISDNVYGSIEEDVLRRDFTVNALYYDIEDFAVLDYLDGMTDLQQGILRLIGDPEQRYREDPVRMLRAVRFAAKLGFRIDPETEAPIHRLAYLLEDVAAARLFDELLKLLLGGNAAITFELLRLYGLLVYLLPMTERCLRSRGQALFRNLLKQTFINTDARINDGKPVTPSFLFAALLWQPLRERMERLMEQGASEGEALNAAADEVIQIQTQYTAFPRRFFCPMREIWAFQSRLSQRSGKRPLRLLTHARFRAAYDFLVLRAQAGEPDTQELAQWWTRFQELSETEREQAVSSGSKSRRYHHNSRRRKAAGAGHR